MSHESIKKALFVMAFLSISACTFGSTIPLEPLSTFKGLSECHYWLTLSQSDLSRLGKLPVTIVAEPNGIVGVVLSPFGNRITTLTLTPNSAVLEGESIVSDPKEFFVAAGVLFTNHAMQVIGSDFVLLNEEECRIRPS